MCDSKIIKPLSTFLKPVPLINLSNTKIKNKNLGNAVNRTQGTLVRNTKTTSVLCSLQHMKGFS